MKKDIARLKKRHLRELILHRIREKRRLSRLNVKYNPNKESNLSHKFKLNPKFKASEPKYGKDVILFPSKMNFNEEYDSTINVLLQIKNALLSGTASEVFLDQRNLEQISPEAAVVLQAELKRALVYTNLSKVKSNYPKNTQAASMLNSIGFYRSLNVKSPPSKDKSDRIYFKVILGNKSIGRVANGLISSFERVVLFTPAIRRRLYEALMECMDNVHAHAYSDADKLRPDLIGEWWMAGFCDPGTGQLAFIFYDQGLGIPTTLKDKAVIRLKNAFHNSHARMIRNSIYYGVSRKKSDRRGNGLPSLKAFIDAAPGGFLRVISNYGDFTYCKNERHRAINTKIELAGSLIAWSIQPCKEVVPKEGIIDLSLECSPKQLRLQV